MNGQPSVINFHVKTEQLKWVRGGVFPCLRENNGGTVRPSDHPRKVTTCRYGRCPRNALGDGRERRRIRKLFHPQLPLLRISTRGVHGRADGTPSPRFLPPPGRTGRGGPAFPGGRAVAFGERTRIKRTPELYFPPPHQRGIKGEEQTTPNRKKNRQVKSMIGGGGRVPGVPGVTHSSSRPDAPPPS